MPKHIAVLMGGWSAEREVSLNSGAACAKGLREAGYRVTEIDVTPTIAADLAKLKPDAAFNALHGRFGEDGCMQGVLEMLRIPYTHSGVLASALAMDKAMAKKLFVAEGLRVPTGKVMAQSMLTDADPLPRPYVAKPVNEGSSVGVFLMFEGVNQTLKEKVSRLSSVVGRGETTDDRQPTIDENQLWLLEEYIPGRELTVAVLNDRALAVTELRPHSGFYDYENKYTGGRTDHLIPAPVAKEVQEEAMRMALAAHRALGCRGLSRSDIRYDDSKPGTQGLYLLEVNTQPGMTALSLSPEQAAYAGIDFTALVDMLVKEATLGH